MLRRRPKAGGALQASSGFETNRDRETHAAPGVRPRSARGAVHTWATAAVRASHARRGEVARAAAPGRALGAAELALQALATAFEVAQLAFQVGLQAGPVLALELLEFLDVLLQRAALRVEAAHRLLVALPGVALKRVGLGARGPGH